MLVNILSKFEGIHLCVSEEGHFEGPAHEIVLESRVQAVLEKALPLAHSWRWERISVGLDEMSNTNLPHVWHCYLESYLVDSFGREMDGIWQ